MKIKITNDLRVTFVGATGSGKTELAKHFIQRLNRILVIDPKFTFKLEGFTVHKRLPALGHAFKFIFRPKWDDDERMAAMIYDLYKGKHVTIYCDEVATLSEMFPVSTSVLADIVRTGRERHVAVWSATQRPRGIPRVFFTESEVFFMFDLRSGEDRLYLSQYLGSEVRDPIGQRYAFWYYNTNDAELSLMRLDKTKNYIVKIG